jgi:hypothetical protein
MPHEEALTVGSWMANSCMSLMVDGQGKLPEPGVVMLNLIAMVHQTHRCEELLVQIVAVGYEP